MTNIKRLFTTGVLASMLILATISMSLIPHAYANDLECDNEILTGDISDNVLVKKDKWCILDRVTVNGNVMLEDNSKLDIFGSVINGNIEGPEVDSAVYLSDSLVTGNVIVRGEVVIEGVEDTSGISVKGNVESEGPDDLLVWFSLIQGNIVAKQKTTAEISQIDDFKGSISITETIGNLFSDFAVILFDTIITGNVDIEKSSADANVSITNNEIVGSLKVIENAGSSTLVEFNTIGEDAVCEKNPDEGNTNLDGQADSNDVGLENKGCP